MIVFLVGGESRLMDALITKMHFGDQSIHQSALAAD